MRAAGSGSVSRKKADLLWWLKSSSSSERDVVDCEGEWLEYMGGEGGRRGLGGVVEERAWDCCSWTSCSGDSRTWSDGPLVPAYVSIALPVSLPDRCLETAARGPLWPWKA